MYGLSISMFRLFLRSAYYSYDPRHANWLLWGWVSLTLNRPPRDASGLVFEAESELALHGVDFLIQTINIYDFGFH